MITLAGVVLHWYPPISAVFLIIGLCLLWRVVHLDQKYGKERPTKREIGAMPLEEYRRKIKNPKFRKWVDDLRITIPPSDSYKHK